MKLKEKLTSSLVLTFLKGTNYYVVYFDVSRVGLGFVLIQYVRVVAYTSR